MDLERRAAVLSALAAGLLVVNLVVLVATGDDGPDVAVDDTIETPTDGPADGASPTPGEAAPGAAAPSPGATGGDASEAPTGDGTGGAGAEGDGADAGGDVLGTPTSGAYSYASTGTWSLSGGGTDDPHELPATATGIVRSGDGSWELELVAGDEYADTFSFQVGADSGLDWTAWVLERTFKSGASETTYTCSGDSAYYRPREPQRTASHTCQEEGGVTSNGTIEQVGSEDVTLGDGSVVSADRLLYTYTVTGSNVTGEGRLDLWLDPATGLRLREIRSIATTTTDAQGNEFQYAEDIEFLLRSTTPDA